MKGELGDLLFQSVFHAQMAEERGLFTFHDVAKGMSDKMVARHPHVFGDQVGIDDADAQTENWEAIKAAERANRAEHGVLDGVAVGLPALLRAFKLQKRAARVGFDWPDVTQVLDKVAEEAREVVEARDHLSHEALTEEMGDLLFVMANVARHLGVEPEAALRHANAKFIRRFEGIEAKLAAQGKRPEDSDLEEMNALWNAVKAEEKR